MSRSHLTALAGGGGSPPPSPVDLNDRSRRPGVAHEQLRVDLDAPTAQRVARGAALDGLPIAPWAVIVIESERVLANCVPQPEQRQSVVRALSHEARRSFGRPGPPTQLAAYASALRARTPRQPADPPPRSLELIVPYHTFTAWALAAADAGLHVSALAASLLRHAPTGRGGWEAAAAERGQFLADWIAMQALSVRRGPA